MNEKVTEIYTHMFHPEPIPQRVMDAYDKFNFYRSKITNMSIRPIDLCAIAALAMLGPPAHDHQIAPPEESEPNKVGSKAIDGDGIDNWQPPEPDESHDIDAAPAPQALAEDQIEPPAPETVPQEPQTAPAQSGGPMDAQPKPDSKRRSLSATKLQKLTLPELRVHSQDIYNYKMPIQYTKSEVIAILKSKKPSVP